MINLSINNIDIKARHINSDLFYCVGLTVGRADYRNFGLKPRPFRTAF